MSQTFSYLQGEETEEPVISKSLSINNLDVVT